MFNNLKKIIAEASNADYDMLKRAVKLHNTSIDNAYKMRAIDERLYRGLKTEIGEIVKYLNNIGVDIPAY